MPAFQEPHGPTRRLALCMAISLKGKKGDALTSFSILKDVDHGLSDADRASSGPSRALIAAPQGVASIEGRAPGQMKREK